jgi:DNA uptake protein ComE-like DNA-binding protein
VQRVREQAEPRRYESFRFNPNTATIEDLKRLGFSQKQAESIDHYRRKGGRFRRKEDFAKSFVVADSVFDRLEPYIDIPRIDLNKADSAAFETLPGIGPYFASKMVSYRTSLGGYSHPEQLLDIYHFDREKYDALKDLISCSPPEPYPIWTLSERDLARHPYISRDEAHSIVLYRTHQPQEAWTLEEMHKAGILSEEHYAQLSRCVLAEQ